MNSQTAKPTTTIPEAAVAEYPNGPPSEHRGVVPMRPTKTTNRSTSVRRGGDPEWSTT